MSFSKKFKNKNPFTGGPNNPPKESVPHFKTPRIAKWAMDYEYGEENANKMIGSVNKLIDFYNERPDPNVMTPKEREYRRDVLKAIGSSESFPSVALSRGEEVKKYIIPNLEKNMQEENTEVEYGVKLNNLGYDTDRNEREKQRASIALGLYDDVPEEKRLYKQTDYGWKPKNIPNLTSKEIYGVKKFIKEKGKKGEIEIDDLGAALAQSGNYNIFPQYINEMVSGGMYGEESSNRPPRIYIDENEELIFEQRASTSDDLPMLAKPFVDMDNLKQIEQSGIVNLPTIKFKM